MQLYKFLTKYFSSKFFISKFQYHNYDYSDKIDLSKESNRIGILLINLGTPKTPSHRDIRNYLAEFLSDPRIIEIPRWIWLPILYTLILTTRPRKIASSYASIWMKDGSPLAVYSRYQSDNILKCLKEKGFDVNVELGMRYGEPSISSAMDKLRLSGCERFLIVPLYPQYSTTTSASAFDVVNQYISGLRDQPELRFIKRFNTFNGYISSITRQIDTFWKKNGKPEKLIISFHGLPSYSIKLGDPYYIDCMKTGYLLSKQLCLKPEQFEITFQSRFGILPWIKPYTDQTLQKLVTQGVTKIDVVCPGFISDCLESLYEVNQEYRNLFLDSGGRQFRYIPAFNKCNFWIKNLTLLIEQHIRDWK